MRKVRKSGKLVYGVGINDADYAVKPKGEKCCTFYKTWKGMLERCYSAKLQDKYPTYIGCTCCEEWKYFSKFKAWMEKQDWNGNHLDKDLLIKHNKIYSPDTCIFVSPLVNKFMTDRKLHRGDYPLGVTAEGNFFKARCSTLGTGSKYLGIFKTPEIAHLAYILYKEKLSVELADMQENPIVARALIERYKAELK